MTTENRNCQNCKQVFQIDAQDFDFYKKINVPPPTFCSRCRMQRRNTWRNERSLYKRKCDAPGHSENIISAFAPESRLTVYDQKFWWGDGWDPLPYGIEYDFSRSFFDQYKELLSKVPIPAVANVNPVNSEYCNAADSNKNCYLSFAVGFNENVSYSNRVGWGKDCLDCYMVTKSELSYENVGCYESYKLLWSFNSKNCSDSYFLYNCRNCSNCFGCSNLISKSYYIWNAPYSKEEYRAKIAELDLTTRDGIESLKEKFRKEIVQNTVHKYSNIINSPSCTGDNINNSKNIEHSFDVLEGGEDSKFLQHCYVIKNSYDCMGAYKYDYSYECIDANMGNNNFATIVTYNASNNRYALNCHGCNNIFGCVGLKSKEYCILNRQYSKEEYGKLVPKIIAQMESMPYVDAMGRTYKYGEFFPSEISPWDYNETVAQEYFAISEAEAKSEGFRWRKSDERHYNITLTSLNLPTKIEDVPDSILNEVIECAHKGTCNEQCTTAFKIIDAELQFYRKLKLPIPDLCPNCRHYERLRQRNPLMLWKRKCRCAGSASCDGIYKNTAVHIHGTGECPNEFETSYAPERPEIIYCESCYNLEIS